MSLKKHKIIETIKQSLSWTLASLYFYAGTYVKASENADTSKYCDESIGESSTYFQQIITVITVTNIQFHK